MYNTIIQKALNEIKQPDSDCMKISEILSNKLTEGGYPNHFCLGIWNGGERTFEGVVVDGNEPNNGPQLRFTYDWDTNEFIEL